MSGLAGHLAGWSPAPIEQVGRVSSWSVGAFAGVLDQPSPLANGQLPPMWHWFGFLDHPAQAEIGADGHPAGGHFMPPIPDRRRMFAGGRWTGHRPFPVDADLTRRSSVTSMEVKSGRSGEMAFVTVLNEFRHDGELAVSEEQDIVYRSQPDPAPSATPPAAKPPAPPEQVDEPPAEHALTLLPDAPLLFRLSALTYNTHRIHYDLPYATGVEGYPGLVVHGPLLALLALELPRRFAPGSRVTGFSYRLRRPAFAGTPVRARTLSTDGEWDVAVGVPGTAPSLTASVRLVAG